MFIAGGLMARGQVASDAATASAYGSAAAAFIVLFTFAFGATWLTVPWLYPAECFSVSSRSLLDPSTSLTFASCKSGPRGTPGA